MPSPRRIGRAASVALRRALPSLVIAGVVAVGFGAGYAGYRWLTGSPRFAVKTVAVHGNRVLTAGAVRSLLAIPRGENIFRVDAGALERRLEHSAWIAHAEVHRELPDTLVVNVAEHRAAALVQLGHLYLADAGGRLFKRADIAAGDGAGLPVVTGISRRDYQRHPRAGTALIRHLLAVLHQFESVSGRPAIGEIRIGASGDITLVTYERALAIHLGHGSPALLAKRMRSFDLAWGALAPAQQRVADIVYADNAVHPDRVTVAFSGMREEN